MTLTPQVLTDVRIYTAGADLTGYGNKVELSGMVDDLDVTTFASNGWHDRVGGLHESTTAIEGFWQATDNTMPDDTWWANIGAATVPQTIVPTSGAVSSLAYLTRNFEGAYKITGEVGKVLSWTADAKGNWPMVRGQIMHPQGTARTATGSGTAIQLGAVSAAQKLYANLHVFSVAGTSSPTLTVKVQSYTDNTFASPTDQITFTGATAISGQSGSVAGAITDTWWRVVWTISGSSPSFLFAASAGIAAF
jgi:hypothetical protein